MGLAFSQLSYAHSVEVSYLIKMAEEAYHLLLHTAGHFSGGEALRTSIFNEADQYKNVMKMVKPIQFL